VTGDVFSRRSSFDTRHYFVRLSSRRSLKTYTNLSS